MPDPTPPQPDDLQRWPLPQGWRWMRLGEVAHLETKQFEPSGEPDKQWNYIGLENITSKRGSLSNFLPSRGADIGSAKLAFKSGNILYAKLRPYLQKVYLATFDGISSTDLIPIVAAQTLNNIYLKYFLLGPDHLEYIQPLMAGINLPRLRKGDIEAMPIPVPPLDTQRQIVAKIEALFERVAKARAALDAVPQLLEQLRQSVLAAAFRGDLTRAWREANPDAEPAEALLERIRAERRARFIEDYATKKLDKLRAKGPITPQDEAKLLNAARTEAAKKYKQPEPISEDELANLPELPQGWCWTKLDEVFAEVKNGVSIKPEGDVGARILRISAVRPLKIDYNDTRYLTDTTNLEEYTIKAGDILYTRYNGSIELVGVCSLVREDIENLYYPDKLIRCRCALAQTASWVEIATSSIYIRSIIEKMAKSTSGQTGISGADLKSLIIPLPSAAELSCLVAQVNLVWSKLSIITQVTDMTTQLDQLEQSILSKAFRGELVEVEAAVERAEAASAAVVGAQGSLFEL